MTNIARFLTPTVTSVQRTSILTGKTRVRLVPCTIDQLEDWKNGTLIQNALPNCSADEREFVMTGITAEEWDTLSE
jgi:hypothetical protein